MHGEALLTRVLVQLVVILLAARAGGWLFRRLGQPQVVGEIAAGLILGPSLLGRVAPDLGALLFPDVTDPVLQVLGRLGLVFLMFLVGLEFDFGQLGRLGRTATSVALTGLVAPFLLGLGVGYVIHPWVAPGVHAAGFMLFLATALSITAIPILGRILMEFGLTRTRLGVLTITAAAVDDVLGWIALAAVAATVAGGFQLQPVLRMFGLTVAFVFFTVFALRPLAGVWARRVLPAGQPPELGAGPLSLLLVVVLATAIVTGWIGVFSVFGPFLFGAVLWDRIELRQAVTTRLRDFVDVVLLPVFFTYTGLRTDIGSLDSAMLWACCGLVILAAVAGKVLGCGIAARLGGLSWRESGCVGVLMNTRALMGLVAIHIGYDLGVVPDAVFCMLVLMALATTFMTSPLLRLLLRGIPDATAPVAARDDSCVA